MCRKEIIEKTIRDLKKLKKKGKKRQQRHKEYQKTFTFKKDT